MKRTALNAGFEGLVHIVVARSDYVPSLRHTLCRHVLRDVHPYHWTAMYPNCLECLAEDRHAEGR